MTTYLGWIPPSGAVVAPPCHPNTVVDVIYSDGSRILLMLGQHQVGAVFPPAVTDKTERHPWVWRFWLGSLGTACPEGRAKTEQAAKNAILDKARDWLRAAGIE